MKFNIDLIPKTKKQLIKDIDKCIKKKTQTKKQFFNSIKAGYALKYEHEKFKFLNNKGFYDAEYKIKNQKIIIKKNFLLYILYNLVYWYDLMCNIIKELTIYPKRLSFLYKNYSNTIWLMVIYTKCKIKLLNKKSLAIFASLFYIRLAGYLQHKPNSLTSKN
jgi:hypothetical protein